MNSAASKFGSQTNIDLTNEDNEGQSCLLQQCFENVSVQRAQIALIGHEEIAHQMQLPDCTVALILPHVTTVYNTVVIFVLHADQYIVLSTPIYNDAGSET